MTDPCSSVVHAEPTCRAWGEPPSPFHGCRREPNHGGRHHCKCNHEWEYGFTPPGGRAA